MVQTVGPLLHVSATARNASISSFTKVCSIYSLLNLVCEPGDNVQPAAFLPYLGINQPWSYLVTRNIHLSGTLTGPKLKGSKKGAESNTTSQSAEDDTVEHVFNIYSSVKEDHKLLPDGCYPDWLWSLNQPNKSFGELLLMFVHGKYMRVLGLWIAQHLTDFRHVLCWTAQGIEAATYDDYRRFRKLYNRNLIKLNNSRLKKSKRNSAKAMYLDS